MSFQFEFASDARQARLSGELTIYTVGEIAQQYSKALNAKAPSECDIDLSGVAEIDTAGLQLMLIMKKRPGVETRFCHHSNAVLKLVDLANLGQALGDPIIFDRSAEEPQA
jgi:anti-anti-sigma factor